MQSTSGESIGQQFLRVAGEYPAALALSSPAGRWTYAELERDVRSGARTLIDRIGNDPTPVAVLATHDGPLVATILSIVTAGHIVVVLDPALPADQLLPLVSVCGPPLLVHDEANRAAAEELRTLTSAGFDLLPIAELTTGGPHTDLPDPDPQAPLMLAFTSGTSGEPKAAIITHGVLANLVRGATDALGIGPDDRLPMLFPTSLAVASYPMFLPLLNGGTLATLDVRSVGLAPVGPFLVEERITVAYLAPTVVRFLVDALEGLSFPDLRLVALGGEQVDGEVVQITGRVFAPRQLANGYGTTETGVIALELIDSTEQLEGIMPVGRPVPDVDLFILDDEGAQVPSGEPGEIAIASPYLFHGYWGHPELTAQVLSDDPDGRAGWQLYRTGDFGRLDADGALVVSGRLDSRVKIRGRFVVLGDVDAMLNELPEVAGAVVTARSTNGVDELVAYVVAEGDAAIDAADLRGRLLAQTEPYRVPSRWVEIDELPRLPNGKVDRRALSTIEPDSEVGPRPTPALAAAEPATVADHVEETRSALQRLWEELLGSGPVSIDDDFFHRGGDSLLAAQMLVLAEHELDVTVPMGELITARTVRQLADVVVRIGADSERSLTTAAVVQAGDPDTRPTLWFVHDLQGSAYRIRHLAASLGPDQPVWSFESPLLRGEPNPFRILETFAARYVADLRRVQPHGPYWLAGYSFGGICAYEMARQLRADGEEIAFLGVVDVGPGYRGPGWHAHRSPLRPWFGIPQPAPAGSSLRNRFDYYRTLARSDRRGFVRHALVRTGVARRVDALRFRNDLRTMGRVRPEWRLWYSWEEHWKLAATAWDRQRTYEGTVDLFWADESPSADATMGWGPLVGALEIWRFAGDHMGILEPRGATALADVLRQALDARFARR